MNSSKSVLSESPPSYDLINQKKRIRKKEWIVLKKYFLLLFIIFMFLSIFYFIFMSNNKLYDYHHYEQYANTLLILKALKQMKFEKFVLFIKFSLSNKIMFLQSIPFMLIFGESQLSYTYSRFLFNLFLYGILFYSLTKIMKRKKAFILTLFLCFSYFSIETLASSYIDLTFFLSSSIFFIYTYLFSKNYKTYNLELFISTVLVFFSKSTAIAFIPFFTFFMILYFIQRRETPIKFSVRFICIIVLSFFVLFAVGYFFSIDGLSHDIASTTQWTLKTNNKKGIINLVSNSILVMISKDIKPNIFFIEKFRFGWLVFITYISQIYFIKKRKFFWIYLFIISEFFLILLYNFLGMKLSYRFPMQFYLIYLLPIFEILYSLIKKIKIPFSITVLFCLMLLFSNLSSLKINSRYPHYSIDTEFTEKIHNEIFINFPSESKVFICNYYNQECGNIGIGRRYAGFSEISDGIFYDKSLKLNESDNRFKLRVHSKLNESDFVICSYNCNDYELSDFKYINTKKIVDEEVHIYKRESHLI
ncbi:hypothetical protein HN789_00750 [archaeon]|jgi:hypothetical protein|nr:hypothetical protein [Candidatus Woesearchaeota archaeon]MBT3721353.1 hypothetical protein [archaeon]MBT4022057.1 hypothetical protein [archaeon]MBT4272670.1 hypothetical protein [archaeon]MBT4461468.1 hypothetical protein [archaeon]